jgi:LysM domain
MSLIAPTFWAIAFWGGFGYGIPDALGWFANAFYAIIAFSIVYFFFFRVVPMVIVGIKWDLFSVFRVTIVLAVLAVLLGSIAVVTADWIFGQVLDTLPRTRMARELDRVSGTLMHLTVDPNAPAVASYDPFTANNTGGDIIQPGVEGLPIAPAGPNVDTPARQLKPNALELWAATMQQVYNPTGKPSDNGKVIDKRDVPQGVTCDVGATAGGYFPRKWEEWELICTFQSTVSLRVNGTAARGLTGGGYYAAENPYTIYGTGVWPTDAYAPDLPAQPTPAAELQQGGPAATPAPTKISLIEHKVKVGESLGAIAEQYHVPTQKIVAANAEKYPQLKYNPNVLSVGWTLQIPGE